MNTAEVSKTLKQIDPIWKRLRFNRIWVLFFAIYMVLYLCYYAWAVRYGGLNRDASFIWVYVFFALLWVSNAVGHFQQEQYWKQIGQRRLEAINDAQPFLATNQPPRDENALTLPVRLHLHWHRGIVIAIGVLGLIPVILLIIFGSLALQRHSHTFDFLIPLVIFIVLLLVVAILVYFVYLRNVPSLIELDAEGIKTRYMRQERSLRWDEARVFAMYGAQGTKKSTLVFTYELSNEQTVVRWSQQMLTNPFLMLTLESNSDKKEDWNWQISRINSIVAARTGLPLLDLSDRKRRQAAITERRSQFSGRQVGAATSREDSLTPIRIAQDDPLVRRTQWNGETGKAVAVLGGIAIIALLAGLFGKFGNSGKYMAGFFSVGLTNLLLGLSILLLVFMLLLLPVMFYTNRYWGSIRRKRQEALQQPEDFLVSAQEGTNAEQPLPATVHIHTRKSVFFPILFVENFVLWLIFTTVVFQWPQRNLLATLLSITCIAIVMSLLLLPAVGRSTGWRIEVKSDGIAGRYGMVDSYVSWNDARLFARYGALRLVKRSSRIQLYELASEHAVVRWQWSHSRLWMMILEPQMSWEEFDRWQEQLRGYVMTRTGLSLVDLDVVQGNHHGSATRAEE